MYSIYPGSDSPPINIPQLKNSGHAKGLVCKQPLLITGLPEGMNLYSVSSAVIRAPTLGVVSVHHVMELF